MKYCSCFTIIGITEQNSTAAFLLFNEPNSAAMQQTVTSPAGEDCFSWSKANGFCMNGLIQAVCVSPAQSRIWCAVTAHSKPTPILQWLDCRVRLEAPWRAGYTYRRGGDRRCSVQGEKSHSTAQRRSTPACPVWTMVLEMGGETLCRRENGVPGAGGRVSRCDMCSFWSDSGRWQEGGGHRGEKRNQKAQSQQLCNSPPAT